MSINLPPYEITHPLVQDLTKGMIGILGKPSIRGIYLGGSLAIGGFNSDTSDLDFLTVLAAEPDKKAVEALDEMHEKIRALNKNRLYTNYEGNYITVAQAQNPLKEDIVSPHLGTDGHFDVENHGPAIVIDLWKIRKSGFTVFGESPAAVIGEISKEDMINAKKSLLKSWWVPKLERRDGMDSEYQAYAILTMARILYGIKQQDEVSKKEAAEWLMRFAPEYKHTVQKALDWKEGVTLNEQENTYSLIAFIDSQI